MNTALWSLTRPSRCSGWLWCSEIQDGKPGGAWQRVGSLTDYRPVNTLTFKYFSSKPLWDILMRRVTSEEQSLPDNHTLGTPRCHGTLPARHRSWSSPSGTQSTPTTRWRAPTSSLSPGPLPCSHAGKSTLVQCKIYSYLHIYRFFHMLSYFFKGDLHICCKL